jgi:dolichyl-phosphate-mannose--protein O-mannosyl transferase
MNSIKIRLFLIFLLIFSFIYNYWIISNINSLQFSYFENQILIYFVYSIFINILIFLILFYYLIIDYYRTNKRNKQKEKNIKDYYRYNKILNPPDLDN